MLNDAQVTARSRGIGGSDAGVILGVSGFKTALRLWKEKRGEVQAEKMNCTEYVYWGHVLEAVIVREYEKRTGARCRSVHKTMFHRRFEWMLCNVDRIVIGDPSKIVEAKTIGGFAYDPDEWGPEASDKIPPTYYAQCQHNLEVTRRQICDVPVLIGGNSFRLYHVPRNQAFIEKMIAIEEAFWLSVKTGSPMPAASDLDDIKLLFPVHVEGKWKEASEEIIGAVLMLARQKRIAKEAEEKAIRAEMDIKLCMGEAERLNYDGDTLATWRTDTKGSRRFLLKYKEKPIEMAEPGPKLVSD